MITDHISNSDQYLGLSKGIQQAFDFAAKTDLSTLDIGKYPIDGDKVFVLIQAYAPKKVEEGKCEAHKNYIDIQYVIEGKEQMGYGPVEGMEVVDPYDPSKDRYFVNFKGDMLTYDTGMFAIFFPQDAHMPGIEYEGCDYVKKAVFKIKCA